MTTHEPAGRAPVANQPHTTSLYVPDPSVHLFNYSSVKDTACRGESAVETARRCVQYRDNSVKRKVREHTIQCVKIYKTERL